MKWQQNVFPLAAKADKTVNTKRFLWNRASTICQDRRDLCVEINRLKQDLQPNGYLQSFTDSVVNCRDGAHSKKTKEDTPLCYVHIPYVKGVSEKFRRYNIRTIFKIKHTLRSSLVENGSETDGTA
jgi:hypothetical protein